MSSKIRQPDAFCIPWDQSAFLKAEPTFTLTQTSASAIESLLAPFLHRAADVLTSLAAAVEKVKVPNFLLDVFDLSSDGACLKSYKFSYTLGELADRHNVLQPSSS